MVNPPSYDAPPWSPGITVNNADSTAQALAAYVFQNQLYLFWKANDPSNHIFYSASADGQTWPAGRTINDYDSTPQALAACVFQNQLYLFWKANDPSNHIFYSASANGQTWPAGRTIDDYDSTPQALAACVFQNQLYLFWKANDPSNHIFYSASAGGQTWPNGSTINDADSTPQALAACVFQNQLYLFWKANDPSNNISYSAGPSHAKPGTAWWAAGFGRLQSLGNDRIDWVLRVGATDPATVLFVLEADPGITWKKVLNVPDGQGSSWNIFTQDAKKSDAVSLWAQQVNNGQSLTFSKAGFLGFMTEVGTLGSLGGLPAGSSVTFRWVQD